MWRKGAFSKRVFSFFLFVKIEGMRQLTEIHISKLKVTVLHLIVTKTDVFREKAEHLAYKNWIFVQKQQN
jgi:hypothetical protein